MTPRTSTTSVAGRSVAMRRLRRRAAAAQPYCNTNGCTSYLMLDPAAGLARCEICGYTRRLH